jgi:hypothetical protein
VQIDELGWRVEDLGHHRPGTRQPLLAVRVVLASPGLLLALEHDEHVDRGRVLLVPHGDGSDEAGTRVFGGLELLHQAVQGILVPVLQLGPDQLRPHDGSPSVVVRYRPETLTADGTDVDGWRSTRAGFRDRRRRFVGLGCFSGR